MPVPENKNTILIVDDDSSCVEFLVCLLENEYTLHVVMNGNDAITTAMNIIPDLILMDVMMPDMTGFEVLRAMKHLRETENIPVVFVTSQNSFAEKEKGLHLGAVDYLLKSYTPDVIKERIKTQIQTINNS
jgi:putative two-component system response regulator